VGSTGHRLASRNRGFLRPEELSRDLHPQNSFCRSPAGVERSPTTVLSQDWECPRSSSTAAAGRPLAETFPDAEKAGVPWTHIPFNYPPMAVAFFTLVPALGGGPMFAKLVLTVFDEISSALMFRLTRRRWLAVGYWISPISIWWTSHEGQFEAPQTMFGLAALATINSPLACGLLLACAIQSKVTAAALGPFLLWKMYQNHTVRKFLLGGFVGMTPAVVTQLTYPMLQNIRKYSLAFRWNPFYWNPVAKAQTWSGSVWFGRIVPQVLSWLDTYSMCTCYCGCPETVHVCDAGSGLLDRHEIPTATQRI
jgi:hypothetical protein